jgi:hypothetical protein
MEGYFFEKKKQKILVDWDTGVDRAIDLIRESFLVLFSKKARLPL